MKNFARHILLFVYYAFFAPQPQQHSNRYYADGTIKLPNIVNQAGGSNQQNIPNYIASLVRQGGTSPAAPGSTSLTPQQINTASVLTALASYTPIGQSNLAPLKQQATSVIYTMVNGTGAAIVYFIIGNKQIADAYNGASTTAVTSCSDNAAGATLNNYILQGNGNITFTSTIYTAGTGEGLVQFPQRFSYVSGDFDGTTKPTAIQPAVAQNPANQNVDQLKFMNNWTFNQNTALVLTVAANTTVQLVATITY